MNVFKRMKDITSSNINSLLDKLEDPEKLIDLSIRELSDTVQNMKVTIAEKTGELRTLKDSLKLKEDQHERWSERAKLALEKGNEELSREAIEEKLKIEKSINDQKDSIATLESLLSSLIESRKEAEEKLNEMRQKSFELKSRAKISKERIKAKKTIEKNENASWNRRLEEVKAKLDKWEAETANDNEKDSACSFEELERNAAIDRELEELKKKIAN